MSLLAGNPFKSQDVWMLVVTHFLVFMFSSAPNLMNLGPITAPNLRNERAPNRGSQTPSQHRKKHAHVPVDLA